MDFDLQALRITSGWMVEWNTFTEAEPIPANRNAFMGSSLLYAVNITLLRAIDLTWEPERDIENGRFILQVLNLTEEWNESNRTYQYPADWEDPHLRYETPEKSKIVKVLELLFRTLKPYEDQRILRQRGVVDEEAEKLRLRLSADTIQELFQPVLTSRNRKLHSLLIDHPSVTSEMLSTLIESDQTVKAVKNKARQKLHSNAFKNQT